jgi:hypothetical protein
MNRLALGAAAAVIALLMISPAAVADQASDLAVAKAKWSARGGDDYSYRVEYRAFIPRTPATVVKVVNGKPRSAPEQLRRFDTVEELFALVENTIATAGVSHIRYAPNTGIPISMVVDQAVLSLDDEWSLKIDRIRVPRGR